MQCTYHDYDIEDKVLIIDKDVDSKAMDMCDFLFIILAHTNGTVKIK